MAFGGAAAGGGFMWGGIAAVVIVILLLIALGLVFQRRWLKNQFANHSWEGGQCMYGYSYSAAWGNNLWGIGAVVVGILILIALCCVFVAVV